MHNKKIWKNKCKKNDDWYTFLPFDNGDNPI